MGRRAAAHAVRAWDTAGATGLGGDRIVKLASFVAGATQSYGVVTDAGVVDIGRRLGSSAPDLKEALAKVGLSGLADAAAGQGADHALGDVVLLPPITAPGKIFCVGLNYRKHIEEMGRQVPDYPTLFVRYPDSLVGAGQPMVRPKVSQSFDFEGELAVVIGKEGRHIAPDAALDHVAGYACLNDGSLRDFQRHTSQFTAGKTFWHSGAFGPWLTSANEVGDPHTLRLATRLNGAVVQDTNTADLVFRVPDLIAYISQVTPLSPGDVIATGTPGGVGAAREPKLWMKPGDTIEIEIEKLGLLANPIIDED